MFSNSSLLSFLNSRGLLTLEICTIEGSRDLALSDAKLVRDSDSVGQCQWRERRARRGGRCDAAMEAPLRCWSLVVIDGCGGAPKLGF
jgi:hypothetical protein